MFAESPPIGMRRTSARVWMLWGLSTLLVGCWSAEGKEGLVEAYGTVTLDGKPLAGAQVTFDHPDHPETFGRTNSSGYFEMAYTFTQEGAFAGDNVVSFTTVDEEAERGRARPEELVPRQYQFGRSQLTVEVTEGGAPYDFDLTTE